MDWRNWSMCPENYTVRRQRFGLYVDSDTRILPWWGKDCLSQLPRWGDHESAPQTQKDAFHNLLTGAVRHWMWEDYWDGGPTSNWEPPRHERIYTQSTAIDSQSTQQVQHNNHKVALFKDCDAIPGLQEHWDPNVVITMADDQGGTVHSTSSCSNCCVSRACVTKPKLQEHSRWRTVG